MELEWERYVDHVVGVEASSQVGAEPGPHTTSHEISAPLFGRACAADSVICRVLYAVPQILPEPAHSISGGDHSCGSGPVVRSCSPRGRR